MKKRIFLITLLLLAAYGATPVYAYWVWSPELGKWVNPKKSAKDTPEDQFQWAMGFFEAKDWDRAIGEFEKMPTEYPNSKLTAEGVYYMGKAWEQKNDFGKAVDAYQKLIDRYPYSDRIKDAIQREFEIAGDFANGEKLKLWGIPILDGQQKALETYQHIVKNAPFGTFGDQAQFKIGDVYKTQEEFELAKKAYQAVIDEYPSSPLVADAKYQLGYVAMLEAKKSHFNEQTAERAIEDFKGFKSAYPENEKSVEADESIKALRAKKAQSMFETAAFYEKRGKFKSAGLYYKQVADNYGDTPIASKAEERYTAMVKLENEPDKESWMKKLPSLPKIELPKPKLPEIKLPKPKWPKLW